MMIKCIYLNDCLHAFKKCKECKNNKRRNYMEDHFKKHNDKSIPDECPKLSYDGSAEQTLGYKCPVCGRYTNPYQLDEERLCSGCGYRLNIG